MKMKQLRKILALVFLINALLSSYGYAEQTKERQTKQEGTVEPIDDDHGRAEFEGMIKAGRVLIPGLIKTTESKIEGVCAQLIVLDDPIGHLGGMFVDHHLPADHIAGPKLKKLSESTFILISKYCNDKPLSDSKVDWPALKAELQDIKDQIDTISQMKIFVSQQ